LIDILVPDAEELEVELPPLQLASTRAAEQRRNVERREDLCIGMYFGINLTEYFTH
jgi:hypothetical protein